MSQIDDDTRLQTDSDFDDSWAFYTSYTSASVNTPRSLVGYTAVAGLQRVASDDDPMPITTGNGLLTIQDNVVIMHVPFDNADKVLLPLGEYELDLVLIDGSGNRAGGVFKTYRNRQGHT